MTGEKGQVTGKTMVSTNNKNDAGSKFDIFNNPIINYLLKNTTIPEPFIKTAYLVALSQVLGQRFRIHIPLRVFAGGEGIQLNLWAILIGPTNIGKTRTLNKYNEITKTAELFYSLLDPALEQLDKDNVKNDKKLEIIYEKMNKLGDLYIDGPGTMEALARLVSKEHEKTGGKFAIVLDELQTILKASANDYLRKFLVSLIKLYDGVGTNLYFVKETIKAPKGLYVTALFATQSKHEILDHENYESGYMRRTIPAYSNKKNGDPSEIVSKDTDQRLEYAAEIIMMSYAARLVEDLGKEGLIVETIDIINSDRIVKKIQEIIRDIEDRIEKYNKENDVKMTTLLEGKETWLAQIIGILFVKEYVKKLLEEAGTSWEEVREKIKGILEEDIKRYRENKYRHLPKKEYIKELVLGKIDVSKEYLDKLLENQYIRLSLIVELRKHYRELLSNVKNAIVNKINDIKELMKKSPNNAIEEDKIDFVAETAGLSIIPEIMRKAIDKPEIVDQVNNFLEDRIREMKKFYEEIYSRPDETQEEINIAKKRALKIIMDGEERPCAVSVTYYNNYMKTRRTAIRWLALQELYDEGKIKIYQRKDGKGRKKRVIVCVAEDYIEKCRGTIWNYEHGNWVEDPNYIVEKLKKYR